MLSLIAAEGNPQFGIVAILQTPFPHVMGNLQAILRAKVILPFSFSRVGRVKEYGRCTYLPGNRLRQDALPIDTSETATAQSGGQGVHIGIEATRSVVES